MSGPESVNAVVQLSLIIIKQHNTLCYYLKSSYA